MWIDVITANLDITVRAILSSDGVWFFLGTDAATILKYSNTTHFNRIYCDFKIKDVIYRGLWDHLTRKDLNTPIVDLETLEKFFAPHDALDELKAIFYPSSPDMRVMEMSGTGPSLRRNRPVVVGAFKDSMYPEMNLRSMIEFLDTFKKEVMEIYDIMSQGLIFDSSVLDEDDAPPAIRVSFRDGNVRKYELVRD